MNSRNLELIKKAILTSPSRREADISVWQVAEQKNPEVCARLRQNNEF